jgi:hypothetical protein
LAVRAGRIQGGGAGEALGLLGAWLEREQRAESF